MLESHLIFWKPITLYFRWWWLRVHFLLPEPLQPWLLWACASPPSSMMSFHSCFYSFKPSSWPDPKGLNPKFGGKVSNTIGRVILNPFLERRCSNGPQTWYYAHHELSQHSGHTYFFTECLHWACTACCHHIISQTKATPIPLFVCGDIQNWTHTWTTSKASSQKNHKYNRRERIGIRICLPTTPRVLSTGTV